MIIEINNLGYVKNVKVNLNKDLIVLCGPNNTGKTYVAYAIYGLMKHRYFENEIRSFSKAVKELEKNGEVEIDLVNILRSEWKTIFANVARAYEKQLPDIFASTEDLFKETNISLFFDSLTNIENRILNTEISRQISFSYTRTVELLKIKGTSTLSCLLINSKGKEKDEVAPLSIFINALTEQLQKIFFNLFFSNPYIATAERIAINLFSKELSIKRNMLVDTLLVLKDDNRADDAFDEIRRRATRYPLPIRDSLEIAEDLNNFKKQFSKFDAFADEIEKTVLKGKVKISKDGELQYKPDVNKRVTLPIHLSASVVKSFSNLVIYFRHLARENDLIILDEPEMNLHPDNQVIVARIIGKMVNKGFKVIVNTHSDYIIRELNNLIMLSSKQKYLEQLGYSENEVLKPEQVDAILFRYDNKRKGETLKVTETGFEVDTIDEVINQLNSRSQSLYFDSLS
jgi:predicted ATP-dependent endonuclease of OLD family